ncbi:MAG: glycosyltransferase family 4 protein [Akkermansiaceae bacterium]
MKNLFLYGAHPEECSISMEIYRKEFSSETSCNFSFREWPSKNTPVDKNFNRWKRLVGKYLYYPLRVYLETRLRKAEVVHFLDHSSAHLIPYVRKSAKVVVTLHDLIPLSDAQNLTKKQVDRFRETVMNLQKADHIVSVSAYSKSEAQRLLGIDEHKISVVPNGVRSEDSKQILPEIEKLKRHGVDVVIFSIGSKLKRKNLDVLPQLFKEFAKLSDKSLALVRAGAILDSELKSELCKVLGKSNIVELGRVETQTIWDIYFGCDLVIVPSHFEGFGLPVIEAFAAGKPVIASNTSSLPEVGGSMAEYFTPTSPEEGAKALCKIIDELPLSEGEVTSRKKYAAKFTWGNHVQTCLAIYETL